MDNGEDDEPGNVIVDVVMVDVVMVVGVGVSVAFDDPDRIMTCDVEFSVWANSGIFPESTWNRQSQFLSHGACRNRRAVVFRPLEAHILAIQWRGRTSIFTNMWKSNGERKTASSFATTPQSPFTLYLR